MMKKQDKDDKKYKKQLGKRLEKKRETKNIRHEKGELKKEKDSIREKEEK
jgi:hypothetical protein